MRSDFLAASSVHDLPLGPLDRCQICGSEQLEPILDLGHQSPCDSLLTPAQLREAEITYPLHFVVCTHCWLAQIDYVVAPEVLFHIDYPYRSGITESLKRNLYSTAAVVTERSSVPEGSLVVDIGSNDGTLLRGFQEQRMRALGVEATNVAKIAVDDGVETVQAFFSEALGEELRQTYGAAKVVTATNMFAHVQNLGDLMRGVSHLLEDEGVLVTESHYLLDLLRDIQYDSIYHEHLKFYSLRPLIALFETYGFTLADVDRIPNYGGSIRVYAVKGEAAVSQRVHDLLDEEERAGLYALDAFRRFGDAARESRRQLRALLTDLSREGQAIPGIGCPGRASTLINTCGIDRETMPYIAEQSSSLKLGLALPGMHIPVVDEERLFAEQPAHALMLSWHYAEPIIATLRERGLKSAIVVPLPRPHVLD
jgi:hypothetical protein